MNRSSNLKVSSAEISIFRTIAKQQPGQKLNETGYEMILKKKQKYTRKISSYINI